jgi:glycosyltransferase involved in cell wall biosynthesis
MKILFISGREISYSRNRIILDILSKNHDVKICTTRFNNYFLRIISSFFVFLFWNIFYKKDIIFIGFFGQPLVPFIRLFSRKKIIFDAYLSMYNTLVEDRKVLNNSFFKRFIKIFEFLSCKYADKILLDTNQSINYFLKLYKVDKSKFYRLLIGVDDTIFDRKLIKREGKKFNVFFHGNFIPLQGVEYIIKAANLVKDQKDISFYLIGSGASFFKCKSLALKYGLKNIFFLGRKKYLEIPSLLNDADIGLGIFGNTVKTKLVIPNKVYELAALSIPIITSTSKAINEVFKHKEDIFLCKAANPEDLADSILLLKKNTKLRRKIGINAYKTFKSKFSKKELSKTLNEIILNE